MMPHHIQLDVCTTTVDYVSSVTAEHNSKEISYLIELMYFKSHTVYSKQTTTLEANSTVTIF